MFKTQTRALQLCMLLPLQRKALLSVSKHSFLTWQGRDWSIFTSTRSRHSTEGRNKALAHHAPLIATLSSIHQTTVNMNVFNILICAFGFLAMAMAMPQGAVGGALISAADGCETSYDGKFSITIVDLGKRSLETRSTCGQKGALEVTLKDGVLVDSLDRIGSVVANHQFQFDGPPQANALAVSGFSVCGNGSLALNGSTVFYQCKSGSFWNLYDIHLAEQCSPIHLSVLPCGEDAPIPTGNIVGTTMVATALVSVIEDGQPQVIATTIPVPVCQIGDGQIQGHTTPCGELPPVTRPAPPATPTEVPSEPAYTPPGTPVAPPAATTPVVPPVETTPPADTTVPVNTPVESQPPVESTPVNPPGSTTPAAPPVAGGTRVLAGSLAAAVVGSLAILYMI
ncbi:Cell wall mannoprotein CIS3 [Colletotrichum orbiculare MAFF 240422]|uniref:Cell wall mannoprotein CIS3 n=2 Tax=Colletotrichum orbiculare species complex TaxID=2707354 RepID=A0A484FET4_COLOR|nr:Cell wall mannoprotein CIS3 [Colletotrichum orbiculare MAFF 240422]